MAAHRKQTDRPMGSRIPPGSRPRPRRHEHRQGARADRNPQDQTDSCRRRYGSIRSRVGKHLGHSSCCRQVISAAVRNSRLRIMLFNKNLSATIIALGGLWPLPALPADPVFVDAAKMPVLATVDTRFQSFNIEMLEVTGGRFWKPYKVAKPGSLVAGPGVDLYEYRPPIDLTQDRLRKLAAALGPAFLRVSGTWANSTYFQDTDGPSPATLPRGFTGVLTRRQWNGVVAFSHAVNAELVVSFATSGGSRDARGVWTLDQARAFVEYTKSIGGRIAAAEFMNEPSVADRGCAPK